MERVNLEVRADGPLDGPAEVQSEGDPGAVVRPELRPDFGVPRVGLQVLRAPQLDDDLDGRDEGLVRDDLPALDQVLVQLALALLLRVVLVVLLAVAKQQAGVRVGQLPGLVHQFVGRRDLAVA